MSLSQYLTEGILSKRIGQYKKGGPLIFDKDSTPTEYQDAIANLEKAGAKEFYISRGTSYLNVIEMRTQKFNNEKLATYCLYKDNVQPTIVIIAPGPLKYGKIACVLRYHKESRGVGVDPTTPTKLLATHFMQYDGNKWTQIDGPNLGSYNDPREHQDEITSIITA